MKILIYSAYPGFSGSHRMAMLIARACHDAGHGVVVCAPDDMEILERARAEGMGTAIIRAPGELLTFGKALMGRSLPGKIAFVLTKLLPYSLKGWRFLRSRNFDVVYAAQDRAVVQIGIAAKLARVPLLWHVQGGLLSAPGWRRVYWLCDRLSTRLVCVSRAVADTVEETLGVDISKKVAVIHNGVADLPGGGAVGVATDPAGDRVSRILFLGNIVPEKGPHHLINSVARLAREGFNVELAIGGRREDEGFLRFLESLIAKSALENRVEILGFRDDVAELIERSELIVCPSIEREHLKNDFGEWEVNWKEGFCLVALEAMRGSRAVIASDSYGLKEVVAHGETGIRVPPGDEDALVKAIRELLDAPGRRNQFGRNGRRRYEEHFSLESMTGQFLREFESLGGS